MRRVQGNTRLYQCSTSSAPFGPTGTVARRVVRFSVLHLQVVCILSKPNLIFLSLFAVSPGTVAIVKDHLDS